MLIKFYVQIQCWEEVMLDLGEENNLRMAVLKSGLDHTDSYVGVVQNPCPALEIVK